MRLQPIVVLGALAVLARRYPKTCAAMAFEVGVLAASIIKGRGRRRPSRASHKIIDVTPVRATPPGKKRRRATRKPKRPATTTAVADAA